MDETIGVKDGHNDYKRRFIITKKQKEKLRHYQEEKEFKELEKQVKEKQKYILIKTLPIILLGGSIKKLNEGPRVKKEPKDEVRKEENIEPKKEEIKETREITIVLENGKKQTIDIPKNIINTLDKEIITKETKKEVKTEPKKEEIKEVEILEEKQTINKKEEIKSLEEAKEEKKEEKVEKEILTNYKEKEIPKKKREIEFEDLTENQQIKLQKLQARKIIDVYEKELKDIRYDLRNLIIDYNTLIDEEQKIIKKSEEEQILDRLNEIIKKIEILKEKIKIDDLDKYDDNYIYTLIEEYLEDFKDKKIIKEIKDSPLYVAISSKLDEFDKKKEKFKEKVEDKKEKLNEKEEDFENLKEKYLNIDKINKNIEEFYYEQKEIVEELNKKIEKATTVSEKVEVEIEMVNRSTRKLLRKLSLMMLIPGPKGAKAFTEMTKIYSSMLLNPKTITKKYKVITVHDYSKDIERNIEKIEEVTKTLSNTSKDIDSLISKIKEDFKEYAGVIKEYDELISNLEDIKTKLREKEYEIERVKEEQKRQLERNNAKVLTRGTYPM